jgi:hypothetical protein
MLLRPSRVLLTDEGVKATSFLFYFPNVTLIPANKVNFALARHGKLRFNPGVDESAAGLPGFAPPAPMGWRRAFSGQMSRGGLSKPNE